MQNHMRTKYSSVFFLFAELNRNRLEVRRQYSAVPYPMENVRVAKKGARTLCIFNGGNAIVPNGEKRRPKKPQSSDYGGNSSQR